MKKIIGIFIGILTLVAFFIFKNYYFSNERIKEKQIETFNKRIEEFKNSKSGKIDL